MPLSKKEFAELIREVGPERAIAEAKRREGAITLDPKQIGKGVATRVGEIGKSITEIPSTISSLMDPNVRANIGEKVSKTPITPFDVINAFVPYREAAKQAKSGDVSGAVGRFSTDALLAAAPFAAAARGAEGATEGANALRGARELSTGKSPSLPPPLSDAQMADAALAELQKGPGATINRNAGNLAGKNRYAVGKYPSRNVRIEGRTLTPEDITSFINANKDVLADPENSLGVWAMKDKPIDLDVTGTPASLREALRIGQRKDSSPTGVLSKQAPEEGVYNLGFANRKNPELGNIQVHPNLPPWLNQLVGDKTGEVRIPREWVPVGGEDAKPAATGKTPTASSLEEETYQRMMGKIAKGEPTVSAEAKHQFEARQNVDRRRQAEALQRGEGNQRVAPTDRRSVSDGLPDIQHITGVGGPTSAGPIAGREGLAHPSNAPGSSDFAPQELYQILEHRSSQPNLTEVDPAKYGSGFAGAEMRRKQNYPAEFKDRSYYTLKGGEVENQFKGLPTYEGQIPREKIYDFGKDPLGLMKQAVDAAQGDPGLANTLKEVMAQKRGYLGFMDSSHENPAMRQAVAVFEKLPVRRVK